MIYNIAATLKNTTIQNMSADFLIELSLAKKRIELEDRARVVINLFFERSEILTSIAFIKAMEEVARVYFPKEVVFFGQCVRLTGARDRLHPIEDKYIYDMLSSAIKTFKESLPQYRLMFEKHLLELVMAIEPGRIELETISMSDLYLRIKKYQAMVELGGK